MKRLADRSTCPINLSLESIGDTWSLLIIRDIVFAGKGTFREFLGSEEAIATNILKARLHDLTAQGIVQKRAHVSDKRKQIYTLTEKGIALVPILVEMADWSLRFNPKAEAPDVPMVGDDKQRAISTIQADLKAKL